MTDDNVASISSEMGNTESREMDSDSMDDDRGSAAAASNGDAPLVQEDDYAATEAELRVPPASGKKHKRKNKRKAKELQELLENEEQGQSESGPEMSVASAVVVAAAAALREREELRKEEEAAVAKVAEAGAAEVEPSSVIVTEDDAAGVEKDKKKKRKKTRQTSQEEESAQALLALNKGGLGSSGGADGDEQIAESASTPAHILAPTPAKKSRKKKRSKKRSDGTALEDDGAGNPLPSLAGNSAAADDVDMPDALVAPLPDATDTADLNTLVNSATDNGVFTEQGGIHQQNAIPESQRIITEHLAAHMAKISPSEQQESELMVEQRLINELQHIHPPIIGADGFVAVNHEGGPQTSGSKPRKRKRASDAPLDELVDPQLVQLDEEAAFAAGVTAGDVGPSKAAKKRRRFTAVVPESGEEMAENKRVNRRKSTGGLGTSWGTTTVSGANETQNGGTFSLEERFSIDKALQDYCKVHGMTMDELRDRVWGNTRRKDEFWDSICNAVPSRSRASVYKHVRRSCHIFQQRAKWTPDEDDELADLVKEKGNKWKDIGEAMSRMGEDCRDRYRNYVKCGKDRGTDRWSEEEEDLLKKTVAEHKEISRQILIGQGKPMPEPDIEDNVLINWTTVSEKMENKRSRIQCRYKWKKMLAQKEKVKQAPMGVTYVGGKKKRISFNIDNMLEGDKEWLLYQIRDSGATQENQIPWDQFAKNDKDVGIWTHRDLKNAYKRFRSHIPHKRRPLSEIVKQLLYEIEQIPEEHRRHRFVPNQGGEGSMMDSNTTNIGNLQLSRSGSQHSSATHSPTARSHPSFEHQLFQLVSASQASVAPIASMGPNPSMQNQFHHHQQASSAATTTADMMVDPVLMGQGMQELQKMAGEAIAHSNGLRAAAMQQEDEDENERELRKRLGGYIQSGIVSDEQVA